MSDVQMNCCKYLLPCGMCDKTNRPCSGNKPIVSCKCEHEFVFEKSVGTEDYSATTYKCWKCGSIKIDRVDYERYR